MKKTFKIVLFTALAIGCCGSIDAKKKQKFEVDPDLPMSIRMTQSEIIRNPEGWMLDFSKGLKWNYCHGLECQSFLDVHDHYIDNKKYAKIVAPFYTYVKEFADFSVSAKEFSKFTGTPLNPCAGKAKPIIRLLSVSFIAYGAFDP